MDLLNRSGKRDILILLRDHDEVRELVNAESAWRGILRIPRIVRIVVRSCSDGLFIARL
jgi:hypothetical protein